MSLELQPNLQTPQYIQPSQKSKNSKYTQGLVTGALVSGVMVGGALAVSSYIRSGTLNPFADTSVTGPSGIFSEITKTGGALIFTGLATTVGAGLGGIKAFGAARDCMSDCGAQGTNDSLVGLCALGKVVVPVISGVVGVTVGGSFFGGTTAIASLLGLSVIRIIGY